MGDRQKYMHIKKTEASIVIAIRVAALPLTTVDALFFTTSKLQKAVRASTHYTCLAIHKAARQDP